jgi:hypothetical protein
MPFTKQLPEWNALGTEPPQSKKDAGWLPNDKPPADWWNWFQHLTFEALQELQQNALEAEDIYSKTDIDNKDTAVKDWVKSFGLGDVAILIPSGSDPNTLNESGFYKNSSTIQNAPTSGAYYYIHIKHANGYFSQLAIKMTASPTMYVRNCVNGTWSTWVEQETAAGAQAKADAAEADAINFAKSFGLGDVAKDVSSTDLDNLDATGFYKGHTLTNGPTAANSSTYYYVINQKHTTTYKSQMAFRLDGGSSNVGQVFTRVNKSGVWTAWTELETTAGAQAKADAAETDAINYAKGYGLGTGKTLANATDLNTITTPGFYYTDTAANGPEGVANGFLIVNKAGHVNGYAVQIMTPYVSGKTYTRTQNATVWGAWTQLETTAGAKLQIEQDSYKVSKSGKDSNGVFTTVDHRRKSDNTLVRRSVLTGGTSPQYTTRTVTFYASNGSTVVKTDTFTLSYDADGDLISEV